MDLLREALELKHTPEAYTQQDFDKILGKYSAVADLPGFAFVDELVVMYPEAKFILTDRNSHAWLSSMQASIFAHMDSWPLFFQSLYDFEHARPLRRLMRKWAELFCAMDFHDGARRSYITHVQHCLKVVPKERLLVMRLEEQLDWEDLCAFLEVPIPEQSTLGQPKGPAGVMEHVNAGEPQDSSMWLAFATVVLSVAGGICFLRLVV